jgi:hypothetical protein
LTEKAPSVQRYSVLNPMTPRRISSWRDDACFDRRRECDDDPTGEVLWAHTGLLASMDLDRPAWFFISIAWATGELGDHRSPPPLKSC